MTALNPLLLQAVAAAPGLRASSVARAGVASGRWTLQEAEAFERAWLETPDRAPPIVTRKRRPVTRRVRLSRRRCSFSRYVRRFSIDVLVHPGLSTGAVTTLVYLISRCGRHKQLRTCTSWLAADLGVSPRTIQNHYRQLEQAGFLVRSSPDRLGRTTIYLTDLVEVRSVQKEAAQPVAEHGEGAKNCSPTKETDSKERGKSPTHRKSPDREASGPSEIEVVNGVKGTPVRAASAAVSYRSAGIGHPPGSSSEAFPPRRTCGIGYRRSPYPLSLPSGFRWRG
jgi:DNA-binding MarR family transcriptional regulator